MLRITWKFLSSATWLLVLWNGAVAYNLDTSSAVIYNGTPGSYFGFTVALHWNRDGPIILVGAPRANSSVPLQKEIHQPGALLKCNSLNTVSSNTTCEEVILDQEGNSYMNKFPEYYYDEIKNDMWLGISLDIQQGSPKNDIVTCGHLWKNLWSPGNLLVHGVCYVINSDLETTNVTKFLPLIEISKQLANGTFIYAFGQAGMSAAFTEDGKFLLIGAPGISDGNGNVIIYSAHPRSSKLVYENSPVPEILELKNVPYFGYSATSGRFFNTNDVFFAVGAPRANNHGQVIIFKALEQKANKSFIHGKVEGTQVNEYFGASVLGVDLNNDSYTDLLVGAPLHSLEYGDEGKVYVYLSNGSQLHEEKHGIMGGNMPNARFGTAVANVGDLNQDGFNDIAVGAPYENKNGAVYIYHGSKNGINHQYVQKIEARVIDPALRGFGIHISRGLDIDKNAYPDILVGAYISSKAVLFRARPVIQAHSYLTFAPTQINTDAANCEFKGRNYSCLNVSACLKYTGKNVPHNLDFENEIFVENSQIRLALLRGFFGQNGTIAPNITQKSTLEIGIEECITHVLYIKPGIKDIINPIQVLFRYSLTPSANTSTFNILHPMIDPFLPTNVTSAITFLTGCKNKDCLSNLKVSAEILGSASNGQLIIGNTSNVSLEISVVNEGDPAYLSELLIYLPPNMPSINQDFCSSSSNVNLGSKQRYNASLFCELESPLLSGKKVKIHIKLDATKIPTDRKRLAISLETVTASTEIASGDNKITLLLFPHAIADIGITGPSLQEEVPYNEEFDGPLVITHTYTVMNHGPSPLHMIDIMIHVPIAFTKFDHRTPFVTHISLEADHGKEMTIPATCSDINLNLKSSIPTLKNEEQGFDGDAFAIQGKGNNTTSLHSQTGDVKPAALTDEGFWSFKEFWSIEKFWNAVRRRIRGEYQNTPGETVTINCNKETIECTTIQCSASPFTDIRKVAQIVVSFQVDVTSISNYLGPWYKAELITTGSVSMRDANVEQPHHHPNVTEIKTVLVHEGPPPPQELPLWIIFVSIGTGILLLFIILILLIRLGFFKREQKDKMREIQRKKKIKEIHNRRGK